MKRMNSMDVNKNKDMIPMEGLELENAGLRKQLEIQSKELEMYKNIVKNIPNASITLLDDKFKFIIAGGELFNEFKCEPSSILGKTPFEINENPINEIIVPSLNQIKENQIVSEIKQIGEDQFVLQNVLLSNLLLIDNKKTILTLNTKISKSNATNSDLEKSEYKFRTLFENSPNGILIVDAQGYVIDINQAYMDIIGMTDDNKIDFIKNINIKRVPIYETAGIQHYFTDLIELKKKFVIEAQMRSLFNKDIFLKYKGVPILDQEGEIKGAIIAVEDIATRKKTEAALIDSEEQYRKTINSIDDFIFVINTDFEIVLINETINKWTSIFNLPQNLVGQNLIKIFETVNPAIRKHYQWVFNNADSLRFEQRIHKYGIDYWTEIKILPIKNTYGRVIQIVSVIKDITENKRSEFEMKLNDLRLNALLDFAQHKFSNLNEITDYALDHCLKLTGSSIGSINILNLKNNELELMSFKEELEDNTNIQNFHSTIFRDFFVNVCKDGKPILINNLARFKDKNIVPYEVKTWHRFVSIPIYENEKIVAIVGLANKPYTYDELDVKQIELLMESVWKLKTQIEANKQLKESEKRLRELNATKDKFFSIIAHDLSSPFNSLLGFSDLLCTNAYQYDRDKIFKIASTLKRSAESGFTLLENLLDWSRTQTGRITQTPNDFDLNDLIQEILIPLESKAQEKDIEIIYNKVQKLMVFADPNMLNTALRNLINNAIKFSYIGGKINILTENKDSEIIIHVVDHGIGMEEADKENLFGLESFTKLGTANEKGTGLGLILCKEFIEKNQGRIWLTSKKGMGSTFSFSLIASKISK